MYIIVSFRDIMEEFFNCKILVSIGKIWNMFFVCGVSKKLYVKGMFYYCVISISWFCFLVYMCMSMIIFSC